MGGSAAAGSAGTAGTSETGATNDGIPNGYAAIPLSNAEVLPIDPARTGDPTAPPTSHQQRFEADGYTIQPGANIYLKLQATAFAEYIGEVVVLGIPRGAMSADALVIWRGGNGNADNFDPESDPDGICG